MEKTMNTSRDFHIASGSAHPELASEIARILGKKLVRFRNDAITPGRFPCGEIQISDMMPENPEDQASFSGSIVYIVQPMCTLVDANGRPEPLHSVNDHWAEMILLIDALGRCGAEVRLMIPHLGYARQERKTKSHDPISVAAVIHTLCRPSVTSAILVEVHALATQGMFPSNMRADHLFALSVLKDFFLANCQPPDQVEKSALLLESNRQFFLPPFAGHEKSWRIISPDAGGAGRAKMLAKELGLVFSVFDKSRYDPGKVKSLVANPGDLEVISGNHVLIYEDMIDTGNTIKSTAELLKHVLLAKSVHVMAAHGIFSNGGRHLLQNCPELDSVIVTDTIPQPQSTLFPKIHVVPIAPFLATVIQRRINNQSVSNLFPCI